MEDLPNLLQRDYGLKPQGKSAPMSFSAPIKNSSVPVFDTPVYDDDIFGGLKGVKTSGVPYDDVFSGGSVAPIGDLVGENSNLENREKGPSSLFDDLTPGVSVEKTR
ncbi:hypothetical protein SUGI_0345150 [Cryptomeria japonica]|nr:hypothetical protein SUGI_0345150 [Cryptomeria japonica]